MVLPYFHHWDMIQFHQCFKILLSFALLVFYSFFNSCFLHAYEHLLYGKANFGADNMLLALVGLTDDTLISQRVLEK